LLPPTETIQPSAETPLPDTALADPSPTTPIPIQPTQVTIPAEGSLQNPAWSPSGDRLLFTRWQNGYNTGPADIMIFDFTTRLATTLVSDGSDNVNLPGSVWNGATRFITFSSSRDPHDEIFLIADDGQPGEEIQITDRSGTVAYEPSLSPDGLWVVFESHPLDIEDHGVITVFAVDGSEPYRALTESEEDCRQPNWSPAGDAIVFQCLQDGQWDLWRIDPDGSDRRRITSGAGDKTDASFSPDGRWVVFSADSLDSDGADIYLLRDGGGDPARVTDLSGYAGAPSWSPDGRSIVFEFSSTDPDDSPGTTIWIVATPPVPFQMGLPVPSGR
jgi:TolB protein